MKNSNTRSPCARIGDCKKEIVKAQKFVKKIERKRYTSAIAHFDLQGSTKMMIKNPYETITKMLLHNKMCCNVIEQNNGTVIKELGDAVLAMFKTSGMACSCAIKVIRNLKKYGDGIHTKVTISSGTTWKIQTRQDEDVYGIPVNLCDRMSKHAVLNCVLIEDHSYSTIKEWIFNDRKIQYRRIKKNDQGTELPDFGKILLGKIIVN